MHYLCVLVSMCVVYLVQPASCIKCYVCGGEALKGCPDEVTEDAHIEQCVHEEAKCVERKLWDATKEEEDVARYCSAEATEALGCMEKIVRYPVSGKVQKTRAGSECYCNENKCNEAPAPIASLLSWISSLVLVKYSYRH